MIENLEEIKRNAKIQSILTGIGITGLKLTGEGCRVNCPFVTHSTPYSFAINLDNGVWKCHACDEGGDILELIMQTKNIDLPKAAEILAESSGLEVKYAAAKKTELTKSEKELRTPQQVIEESTELSTHAYLTRKHVDICSGLYLSKDNQGNQAIGIPFSDVNNNVQTIQFINENGKYFLTGGKVNKSFFVIDQKEIFDGDEVYLAEGLATALTIWMAYNKNITVVSFGSAGNMRPVADELIVAYPNIRLIICLDNGETAFRQAMKFEDYSCGFRTPDFSELKYDETEEKPNDFNDIISKCSSNLEEVKKQLEIKKSRDDVYRMLEETKEEVTATSEVQTSNLTNEYQADVINYLVQKPLIEILKDGFEPEHFLPYLFTGIHRTIIEGLIKTWEQGLDTSISQVSLNSGDQAEKVCDYLKQLNTESVIIASQVTTRVNKLRDDYAKRKLNKTLNEAQLSTKPLNEITEQLHKEINTIHGESEIVLSQKQYLATFENELQDTKNIAISTGFKSIDRLLGGGFINTEVGVLTGGAGSGKSAFALQLADNVAQNGACVVYYSIEIPKKKLTERSYKRLSKSTKLTDEAIEKAYNLYEKFADNIFLIKGRSGMLLSEIKGKVLSIKRQRPTQSVLLIIDPFQRLGTGNDSMDFVNETAKVGQLISDIKQMSEDLDMPILVISDTTKEHKNSSGGEGLGRGSYMIDHTCDYMMYLRQSRDPLIALYGTKKEGKTNVAAIPDLEEDPFVEDIKEHLDKDKYKKEYGTYALKNVWDRYASLQTSKVRDNGKFSPLLIYHPAYHSFEETDLWDAVLPKEENDK